MVYSIMKDKPGSSAYIEPPHEKEGPLTREEVLCPICWSLLIRPVTLPCAHSFCLDCFQKTVEEAYFHCPCCRVRTSVWSRRATKSDTLVNEAYWDRIKEQFPRLVEARENGEDSQLITEEDIAEFSAHSEILDASTTFDFGQKGEIPVSNEPKYENEEPETSKPQLCDERVQANQLLVGDSLNDTVNCIRQFKAEDGFGTQRFCFENDAVSLAAQEDIVSSANILDPALSVDATENSLLCRNLFLGEDSDTISNVDLNGVVVNPLPRRKRPNCDGSSSVKASNSRQKFAKISEVEASSAVADILVPADQSVLISSSSVYSLKSSFVSVVTPHKTNSRSADLELKGKPRIQASRKNEGKLSKLDTIKRSQLGVSSDTPDSINVEVNSHFRPIRSAPKTPPKRLPDGSYLPEPRLVKSTPIRLDSAPAIMMLASLSQQCEKVTEASIKKLSSSHSKSSRGSNCKNGSSSPPPPSLVHFSSQRILSPTQRSCTGGRATAPPPDLDDYGEENNHRYILGRQISEIKYRQAQAEKLEQFRIKKLQEEKDKALARKLQRELNKVVAPIVRTRGCNERYAIRNWVSSDEASSCTSNPSTPVPGSKYSLRTRKNSVTTDLNSSITNQAYRKTRSTKNSRSNPREVRKKKEVTHAIGRILRSRR